MTADEPVDGDYPAAGQQIRLRISGIDYREALHDLEAMTGSFVVPLASRLFLVAQDTPQGAVDKETLRERLMLQPLVVVADFRGEAVNETEIVLLKQA